MDTKPISDLVIDGDADSRNHRTITLHKSDLLILLASPGHGGLISARKDPQEISILDPLLPDLPGLELVNSGRQELLASNVPCVVVSGELDLQDMRPLLSAGSNEYLTKSSQALPRLLELIRRKLWREFAPAKKLGILITFVSAKSRMGASSFFANFPMCMGRGKKERCVAVIDLVLPNGSIANIVDNYDYLNIVTLAIKDSTQTTAALFKENLPRVPNRYFHLMAGSHDPVSNNHPVENGIDGIVNAITESSDFFLVEIGRALSHMILPIIQKADLLYKSLATTCHLQS